MGTINKLPSGAYRVRIRRQGSPVLSRTFPTKKEAERWQSEQESALSHSSTLPLSVRDYKVAARVTLADLVERYLGSEHFAAKRPKTQRGEKIKVPHLIRHLGEYGITKLNASLIAAYRDTRLKEKTVKGTPVSRDQVRLEMALLCVILNLAAGEWQLIPANPCKGVRKPKGMERDRRLDEAEEKALRLTLMRRKDKRLLRFFLVAFYTGMRAGEIAELKKSYFNVERRCLDLPPAATKSNKSKRIVLTDHAYNILIQAANDAEEVSPFIFSSKSRNGEYHPFDYGCAWHRVLRKAGISDLHFHDLRHEFVSRLFENTKLSDGQIASLTGHSDPRSLWRYKHLRSELLRPDVQEVSDMLVNRRIMSEIAQEMDPRQDDQKYAKDSWALRLLMDANPDWAFYRLHLDADDIAELKKLKEEYSQKLSKSKNPSESTISTQAFKI